jgi:histidine phosphotransfer protein HptB
VSPDSPLDALTPTLDASALARLRELDPDGRQGVVERVLTVFESSLTRMVSQLADEKEQGGDAGAVAELAHKLKSGAAAVGAVELAQECAEVERRLRSGEDAHLSADIERLLTAGRRALQAVASMLRP